MTERVKTTFNPSTPPALRRLLDALRRSGATVRIVCGETHPNDPDAGTAWMEEHDVVGTIGRSGGQQRVPLLIPANGDGIGGPALLDHCILGVQSVPDGRWLYLDKRTRWPQLRVDGTTVMEATTRPDGTTHESVVARFPTVGKAQAWAAFMQGEIPCLPQHFEPETDADTDTTENDQ